MENINSYLSFKIGDEFYAANVSYINSIIEYKHITKVPDMPDFFLGVVEIRGEALPVVDSRLKLGLSNSTITPKSSIIVTDVSIENMKYSVGILVDEVSAVLEINELDIKEPPGIGSITQANFIIGMYHNSNKFIMLLDLDKVLASEGKLYFKTPI
ncbi:MAG: chemotaxis protein CheW [Bacteroidales bacterium]|nr:chemotaxis protein CheW [Bacteroidales bacterium]